MSPSPSGLRDWPAQSTSWQEALALDGGNTESLKRRFSAMKNPILYTLGEHPWQLFCSLTFKSEQMSTVRRKKMYFAWLRKIIEPFGMFFPAVPWCLRIEDGELTGRRHLHALISGFPPGVLSRKKAAKTCLFTMHTWESLGGGIARVRKFNPALAGVDYILPDEITNGLALSGGDLYELTKFGAETVQELMLSDALQLWLLKDMHAKRRTLTANDERTYADLEKRLGRDNPKKGRSPFDATDKWQS